MAAGATYEPIATTTTSGNSSLVTFSSIPQTYTDLILVMQVGTSNSGYVIVRANGDTDSASNYGNTYLLGNGSAGSSGTNGGLSGFYSSFGITSSSTLNFISTMQILNYSNTTTFKTALTRDNLASSGVEAIVACRRSTSAITSLGIQGTAFATFTNGSTFTLYGIAAA
jgi:hypothetical protein